MPAQARSLARQAAGSPAASDGAALAWNPFKGSTANGTLNPKSLYLGWLGRANLLRDVSGLGDFIPERATTSAHPKLKLATTDRSLRAPWSRERTARLAPGQ